MSSGKNLRIAVFLASDPSETGGIQAFVSAISQELSLRGHDISVFGPRFTKTQLYSFPSYTPVTTSFHLNFPSGFQPRVNFPIFSHNSYNTYKTLFDVVYIHEPYVPFITGLPPFTMRGKVTVAHFHTGWEQLGSWVNFVSSSLPLLKPFYSFYYTGALYASLQVQKSWRELFPDALPSTQIPYGIYPLRSRPSLSTSQNGSRIFNILFLARLVSRKGLLDALEAIRQLIEFGFPVRFTIGGDGPELTKALRFVSSHRLQAHVTFAGTVTGARKQKLFQTAHCFIAPYINEGFGLTILESFRYGVPVVGFMNSSFNSILGDHCPYAEFLAEVHNPHALVQRVIKLINNHSLSMKYSSWSKKQTKQFSWKRSALAVESFFYRLLN